MRNLQHTATLGLTLAAAFLAGCASEKRQEAALARMGDESPPDFLVGPVSAALTNYDGFSANVVATTSAASDTRAVSGQLLERQGRFIFQPPATANMKKGKIVRGGMFFIWDAVVQRGYVVSEALQGFAPISAPSRITIVTPENHEPVSEQANGHPCHRIEKMAALSDGTAAKLTEWRADDLNRFPVRVRAESEGRRITVDLSDIRLDLPAVELFVPPGGFTEYASAAALINELMIRESSLKKGPSGESPPLPGQPANWHQPGVGRP
jgi:hypothetical protein